MASLERVLNELRSERGIAQKEVDRLNQAIKVLQGLVGRRSKRGRPGSARRAKVVVAGARRRTMSASARRKIAAAQKARWAKLKSAKKAD